MLHVVYVYCHTKPGCLAQVVVCFKTIFHVETRVWDVRRAENIIVINDNYDNMGVLSMFGK